MVEGERTETKTKLVVKKVKERPRIIISDGFGSVMLDSKEVEALVMYLTYLEQYLGGKGVDENRRNRWGEKTFTLE